MSVDIVQAIEGFLALLPHAKRLNMRMEDVREGYCEISMPYDPALVGDASSKVIHGGAVSALMDTAGGGAVICHPGGGLGTATLDLRIDYMRSATPGQRITAVAECYHVTRNVAFVRASAFDDDRDRPVATAAGAFTVPQKDHA